MNDTDVMALLAGANPVRVDELPRVDLTVESVLARRKRQNRRLLLAPVAAAVLAATLVGIFAFNGSNAPPHVAVPGGPEEMAGSLPTVAHPLPFGAKQVSLAAAAAAIGQSIVLPDTSLVGPADAGPVWINGSLPNVTTAVTFPSQGVFIEYTLPPPSDPSAVYHAIARETPDSFDVFDLNGGAALVVKQNTDETGHNFGAVIFVLNGLEISVFGHYDEATLQSVAQSIVDRSSTSQPPPPSQLAGPVLPALHVGSVAEADARLPFKVVLPSARPLVLEVFAPNGPASPSISAFFDEPTTGPYEVVEQPADARGGIQTVAQLRKWANACTSRVVCPIHKIVVVHGTHVLLIGAPGQPGGLTAFWLRGDRTGSVLTWIKGPTDYAHGDLSHHRFKPRAVLAVAGSIIARGG